MGNFGDRNSYGGGQSRGGFGGGNRGGFGGGQSRGGFGGGRGRGGFGSDRPREMHRVNCADCGNFCEVPFRPTGEKPVYCPDCFHRRGDSNDRGGFGARRNFGDRDNSFAEKRMYKVNCAKCGELAEVPFRPSDDKPVFCSNCFQKPTSTRTATGTGITKEQYEVLLRKVDRVLSILEEGCECECDEDEDDELELDVESDEASEKKTDEAEKEEVVEEKDATEDEK